MTDINTNEVIKQLLCLTMFFNTDFCLQEKSFNFLEKVNLTIILLHSFVIYIGTVAVFFI